MAVIKNVSPLGDLDIPLLRQIVPAGEDIDVSDDHARSLLAQPGNFQPVDDAARALIASPDDGTDAG